MIKYILILLSLLWLLGCEKNFEYASLDQNMSQVDEPNAEPLIESCLEYWNARSSLKNKTAYKYEMPYQQYLMNFSEYKTFREGSNLHYEIILKKINIINNKAELKLKYKSESSNYQFSDYWYNVNGTWYHKFKMKLLPSLSN